LPASNRQYLLLDSISKGQIGLPSDHLSLSLGEEVGALRDVPVDPCIEQIGDIENQGTAIVHDLSAG
jgi:hypothetical protein